MISFEEARIVAWERNPRYGAAQEYDIAWHFYLNDGITRIGGDTGIIVLKEDGTMIRPYEFFLGDCYKNIKEIGESIEFEPEEKEPSKGVRPWTWKKVDGSLVEEFLD